ncbi:MAG: ribonuclease [Miltoncostaeaceae bacterium]|jgi:ribonuclease Z|nr:ribonuclease [Miltoncostaeaceae bacterium]
MDLFVTFLGTAASIPSATRGTAATLVARGGARWLIDCGEGTQRQLLRSGLGLVDLDLVLLTHFHGDHVYGLPGLLKTYALQGRTRPLGISGPAGLTGFVDRLRVGRLPFPLELDERGPGLVWRGEGARLEAFPTEHSVPSLGFALLEEDRPGQFDVAAALAAGVPEGPLFGRLQRGEEVALPSGRVVRPAEVLGPPRPGRRLVVTGDTRPCEATVEAARGACLLVHEATFLSEEAQRAADTRHSTAVEAGAVARAADVQLLALTHLSSRSHPRDVRREARREFPGAWVPRDFDQVQIPFPERGEPRVLPAVAEPVIVAHTAAGPREPAETPARVPGDDL